MFNHNTAGIHEPASQLTCTQVEEVFNRPVCSLLLGDLEQICTLRMQDLEVEVRSRQVMIQLPVGGAVLEDLGCSVRFHLDPPVQAAGEHHPTDLKTGSVKVKECCSVTVADRRKLK